MAGDRIYERLSEERLEAEIGRAARIKSDMTALWGVQPLHVPEFTEASNRLMNLLHESAERQRERIATRTDVNRPKPVLRKFL